MPLDDAGCHHYRMCWGFDSAGRRHITYFVESEAELVKFHGPGHKVIGEFRSPDYRDFDLFREDWLQGVANLEIVSPDDRPKGPQLVVHRAKEAA